MRAYTIAGKKRSKEEIKSSISSGYRIGDPHYEIYGKEYHEVNFSEQRCPVCGSKIDEHGMCACGAGGA
ncbi:MAG: hypothetical protein ACP5K9_00885 [Candidatus Micrarchaeia archaeon]